VVGNPRPAREDMRHPILPAGRWREGLHMLEQTGLLYCVQITMCEDHKAIVCREMGADWIAFVQTMRFSSLPMTTHICKSHAAPMSRPPRKPKSSRPSSIVQT